MKERIKNLLANGLKATEVATIVGCTPAYISQLWGDKEFRTSVEAIKIEQTKEKTEEDHLDTRYQNLEHKIINNIEGELGNAELPQLVRALEVVGKRQSERRKEKNPALANPTPAIGIGSIHITNIALPAHALMAPKPVVEVNEKNEIIAIDAKPLAPMSSDGVKNIFTQIKERKQQAAVLQQAQILAMQEI